MEAGALLKTIILGLRAKDHESALDKLFDRATSDLRPATSGEGGRYKAFCDLRAHESAEGALSGTGSAIFHCLSEYVTKTRLAVAISPKGVPGRGKGRKTHVFFLLISPIRESGSHLQTLSMLEGFLQDRAFVHALISAKNEDEAIGALKHKELAGKPRYIPLSKDDVLKELGSGPGGLSAEEAKTRLTLTGPNTLRSIRPKNLLKDLLGNFTNLFAILLWIGGALSFVAGLPQLGWAIFLVIVINGLFSFWQEYKAEKAIEALTKLLPMRATAMRDGKALELDARDLVPGDVVELSEGDSIPADGRLIKADDLRVDNSALTGESKPVYKLSDPIEDKGFIWTELPNMVFAGTSLLSGAGQMVVTATGMDTEIGRVAYLTEAIGPDKSPLQREMTNVTRTITLLAVSLGALFFVLGTWVAHLSFVESFVFAIGIIVALVPEGLLPTVTLSLAMGVQRMAKKNALVKRLSSIETLGCATVICTDKTGTLTTNSMCVKALYLNGSRLETTGVGYETTGEFLLDGVKLSKERLDSLGVTFMASASALCANATLVEAEGRWTVAGDPTEGALLALARRGGVDLTLLNIRFPRVAHLPFERVRKMMSTVHSNPDEKDGRIAFIKGAPNEVLRLSTRIRIDNRDEPLGKDRVERILAEFDLMASRGERVLGIACKSVGKEEAYSAETIEKDLVFLGLVSMVDPPRLGVRDAIEECKGAGIKVVMVTGDYGITAKAIANDVGIQGKVVTGEELSAMSKAELKAELREGASIFARVSPQDKLRVVEALQENGEVVAVTGDGVNDAPALKKADIGIAMGLRGSDVAKEASDMILADDNFSTIVDAVREGRGVYANIRKFVTYIFASNIPELVPFITFVIFKVPLPLTVMQILAVDLGTDVLPALALGVEQAEKGVMKEKPRPLDKRLLDLKTIARAYLFLGPIEALLCMSAFFFAFWIRGVEGALPTDGPVYLAATTMTFAAIVAAQIGNVFACKSSRDSVFSTGFFSNRFMLISVGAEVVIALVLIYTPIGRLFGFHSLGIWDLTFLACFPLIVIAAEEARKLIMRTIARRKTSA